MRFPPLFKRIYFQVPFWSLVVYLSRFRPDKGHYFNYLADAFLHGRLNVIPGRHFEDLVLFNGKYYLYWPPVPAIVMMPFVALFGPVLPDAIFSSCTGALNVWLFMKICSRFSEQFSLGLKAREIMWAGLFWAFGTVHFYMAANGDVWEFSQVIAQTFLLSSVYFFLENRRWWLSGILFGLAVYTRNDLVFAGFFFVFLYFAMNPGRKISQFLKSSTVFLIPFVIFSLLNAWYNFARFGDVADNGLKYHLMNDYFIENFQKHGYFSWHYFAHNFYTEVLHWPTFLLEDPFIQEEPEGFGFIWASPFFLMLIPAMGLWIYRLFTKANPQGFKLITIGAWAATLPIATTIFLIMGTGWRQFGARYTLDFQFFLLVFLMFCWPYLSRYSLVRKLSLVLIFLSFIIQAIGAGNN